MTQRTPTILLIVDDETPIVRVIQRMLRKSGYDLHCAHSGPEALALLRETNMVVDLLLSDVMMPGMTGPSLHRVMVEEGLCRRALFMSGNAAEDFDDGLVGRLIRKPFTSAELRTRLNAELEHARAQPQSPRPECTHGQRHEETSATSIPMK